MPGFRHHWLICLAGLMAVTVWAGNAAAHRRETILLSPPGPPAADKPPAPNTESSSGPLILQPESYWKKFMACVEAGDYQESLTMAMSLVNLFPQAPQGEAALLKLAELAQKQGKTAEARHLFGLITSVAPGTPAASQASCAASVLDLAQDLHTGPAVLALRQFLTKMTALSPGYSPEVLKDALEKGWQAVASEVQATSPLPLSLVEEVLDLWDLQPPGLQPPEAARLLADILKKNGLGDEAQTLLAGAGETGGISSRKMAKDSAVERPRPGQDGKDSLSLPPTKLAEQNLPVLPGLPRWQAETEPAALPVSSTLAANRGPATLLYSRPVLGLPRSEAGAPPLLAASSSPLTPATKPVQDKPLPRNPGPFYQDRLGLSHVKQGQMDEAQATFKELAQNNDPFWQRLAQVRLTDLEMSRLQAEPAP